MKLMIGLPVINVMNGENSPLKSKKEASSAAVTLVRNVTTEKE